MPPLVLLLIILITYHFLYLSLILNIQGCACQLFYWRKYFIRNRGREGSDIKIKTKSPPLAGLLYIWKLRVSFLVCVLNYLRSILPKSLEFSNCWEWTLGSKTPINVFLNVPIAMIQIISYWLKRRVLIDLIYTSDIKSRKLSF